MFSRTRVAVLRGGPSSEYGASLKTGATVLSHLPEQYHPLDVFIDREGIWHLHGRVRRPESILGSIDAVWNALHGEYGEDGTLQHILETHHIPFSGSRRLGSSLAQNKHLAKKIIKRFGINTPVSRLIRREEVTSIGDLALELCRTFPQPSIVKPAQKGSSIGVSVAKTADELVLALTAALGLSEAVLVEEYIDGKEAVCGVIENYRGLALYPLLPAEVVLPNDSFFLDEESRWGGIARYSCPGRFSAGEKSKLQKLAQKVHYLLGLRHYSSSEFIIHPRRGIFFIEVDALPCLGVNISPYRESLLAVGIPTAHFLNHVLESALQER